MGEEVLTAEKMDRSEGEYMCVGKSARVRAHTCMWACVQVHVGGMYAHVYGAVWACVHVGVYTYVWACVQVYMWVGACVCICVCTPVCGAPVCMFVEACGHVGCIHVCGHVCRCVRV